MTETTNRKLRARRPKAYLIGDVKLILGQNSDPELFGYARTNYTKDFISPAQELNSIAKLLSKFVNSVNKRLIDKVKESQDKQDRSAKNSTIPNQDEPKNSIPASDTTKKKGSQKINIKDNSIKSPRCAPSVKQLHDPTNTVKDKNKVQEQNKKDNTTNKNIKTGSQPNKNNPMTLQMNQQLNNQGQSIINANNLNSSQWDAAIRAFQQQQQILNYSPHLRQKLQAQQNLQNKNQQQGSEKFFRRCAFHVAIAYQIHVNNLKQKGKDLQMSMHLDPTCPAKKLRDQYNNP